VTAPEYAPLPRITHSDSGVWIENVGLLDGDDAARLVGWLASAVKKHRRRRGTPVPVVTATDDGVEVGGIGRLDPALALAHRLADCLTPGGDGRHPVESGGDACSLITTSG
jgi:hypothetical protein